MKPRYIAVLLAFYALAAPLSAQAVYGPSLVTNRYFLQTTKAFWRTALTARNVFDTGFTADLTDLQLKLAKFAGLKPIVVKKFTLLADSTVAPSASPTPQESPAVSVPWGVQFVLDAAPSRTSSGKGVTVAVLDTGVERTHPDLADRITVCADYAAPTKSLVKDECTDTNGHGTHMAGIIAADGGKDGKGIWGVAPAVDVAVYRVCNGDGLCLSDDIAMGIRAAVDDGANVIVLGMGGEADSSFIDDALQYAADHDVLVIAAAGNDGPYADSMDWPARNPLTVSVGALAPDGTVAEFSSRGTEKNPVELVAPGVDIESTFIDGGYAVLSGSSMAAPHAAGLAARIWEKDAAHPAEATREKLKKLLGDK